jgi:hypothetical protein
MSCSQTKLLPMNVTEVQKITITFGSRSSEITPEDDKELIYKIYELINSTKTRTVIAANGSNEQQSDPYYTITIHYLNGSKETIYSTEGGKFIYKRLIGTGWVGGHNERLYDFINVRMIW